MKSKIVENNEELEHVEPKHVESSIPIKRGNDGK